MLIADLARRYLPSLDATMRAIVDSAPDAPEYKTMLRYPLGWVNADGTPYQINTGKRIRPILLLLSAEAAGGDWKTALPAAAAVELLHNFSLIHDDIQDDSEIRHNRATVWKVWGRANAINAGDAMFTLAYRALERLTDTVSPAIALECWRLFNATNLELTRGQHLDMRFEHQRVVSVEDYLSMIRGKTAALVAAAAQIGALIGSASMEIAGRFGEFGMNLGIAFQIHDDILGIWGDPKVTGKSAATDIISRKKSLPVLYGLSNSTALVEVYQRAVFSDTDVSEAVRLLDSSGAQIYTRENESAYYEQALNALPASQNGGAEHLENLIRLSEALFDRAY